MQLRFRLEAFQDDLRKSRYFKIYCLLHVIAFVVGVIGMVFIGVKAYDVRQSFPSYNDHDYLRKWVDHSDLVVYPGFYFYFSEPGTVWGKNTQDPTINNVVCMFGNDTNAVEMVVKDCSHLQNCKSFASNTSISASGKNLFGSSIFCNVTATPPPNGPGDETRLGWRVVEQGQANQLPVTQRFPPGSSQLLLQKSIIKKKKNSKGVAAWSASVDEGTMSTATPLNYYVTVSMETTDVVHWNEQTKENLDELFAFKISGWTACGVIGGYWYFLMVILKFVLMVLQLCVPNDSQFLDKEERQKFGAGLI